MALLHISSLQLLLYMMIKSILPDSSNMAYTTKNRHVTENTALTKTCTFISNISSIIYFQLFSFIFKEMQ